MIRHVGLLVGFAVSTLAAPREVIAKPAASREQRDERRENKAVREARENLEDARRAAREAETAARDAEQAHRVAMNERHVAAIAVQTTTDRLEKRHADSSGLTDARAAWKKLQEPAAAGSPEELAALRKEAKARVDAAREACDKAVAFDPELRKVRAAFEKARATELQAEQRHGRMAAAVAAAHGRVARAQQALAAKQAADRRDPNRPRDRDGK